MPGQGFLEGRNLIGWDVTSLVPAVGPVLKLVERGRAASGVLDTEFASFHAGDGVHCLEDLLASLLINHA